MKQHFRTLTYICMTMLHFLVFLYHLYLMHDCRRSPIIEISSAAAVQNLSIVLICVWRFRRGTVGLAPSLPSLAAITNTVLFCYAATFRINSTPGSGREEGKPWWVPAIQAAAWQGLKIAFHIGWRSRLSTVGLVPPLLGLVATPTVAMRWCIIRTSLSEPVAFHMGSAVLHPGGRT